MVEKLVVRECVAARERGPAASLELSELRGRRAGDCGP
jgi:hypothetical protein